MVKIGIQTAFRRGVRKTLDDNFEPIDAFYNYGFAADRYLPSVGTENTQYGWPVCLGRTGVPVQPSIMLLFLLLEILILLLLTLLMIITLSLMKKPVILRLANR